MLVHQALLLSLGLWMAPLALAQGPGQGAGQQKVTLIIKTAKGLGAAAKQGLAGQYGGTFRLGAVTDKCQFARQPLCLMTEEPRRPGTAVLQSGLDYGCEANPSWVDFKNGPRLSVEHPQDTGVTNTRKNVREYQAAGGEWRHSSRDHYPWRSCLDSRSNTSSGAFGLLGTTHSSAILGTPRITPRSKNKTPLNHHHQMLAAMVDPTGLEPVTSSMSRKRSNQLS